MGYNSLEECIIDLENNGHLIRIKEEVDPNLEMAAIHLKVHEAGGPAILFENVKGSPFRAVSNLYGTYERCAFMFRNGLGKVKSLIQAKIDPAAIMASPAKWPFLASSALHTLPKKEGSHGFDEISISSIPQIKCWPLDGGAFITLPQVYTEDPDFPGVKKGNLGMYRIQLSGNEYVPNQEIGLHYQIHRGIGVHQTKYHERGEPMKVSIFVGGPPAHAFSAVMPLPENIGELMFAGVLGNRRFRYTYEDGYMISTDADFVICGEVYSDMVKPEGPFGDHLGYYSLTHPFPVMKVRKVLAKPNAIWPFTVVGRPPQEDTFFGMLIHEMTGEAIPAEIPGLVEVNAVDEAGVHPLLLAIGLERYTPFIESGRPQELLTIANHILGKGQLSLAKYLIIATGNDYPTLNTHDIPGFFKHVLERISLQRDIHFYTESTIDTLDYSSKELNVGSKVVLAAGTKQLRNVSNNLTPEWQGKLEKMTSWKNPVVVLPGVIAVSLQSGDVSESLEKFHQLDLPDELCDEFPLLVLCDDSQFLAEDVSNFLWVTFTRSDPAQDIHGYRERIENKHWRCDIMIIDATKKPHHAPELKLDHETEERTHRFFESNGSLNAIV